jgi:hypothetical protein
VTYPQHQDPTYQAWLAAQQPQFVQPQPGFLPPVQQTPPAAVAAPTARASSLADFWDQRSSGEGKSLKFPTVGTSYTFMVTRALNKGDVSQQTDVHGAAQFNRDGSPKWVLVVPGILPDGTEITWWCKGQSKTALQAALDGAGVPEIEAKSIITVTYVKDRPNGPGFSATKISDVVYRRPQGAGSAPVAQTTPAASPIIQPTPAPVSAPPAIEDPAALFQSLLDS